jgi:3-ketosteroid 9alpha-monooxygenase subunit A
MGTHLGRNDTADIVVSGHHVEGDSIRCPFHGWRFGADGKCNQIPYFDGPIPEAARLKSWPTRERYGIVFCWNDPEGKAPDFDLPDYPEWDDPEWTRWNGIEHLRDLPCHPIEIFDNTSDYAHLTYVHGGKVTHYDNEVDGYYYHQRESQVSETSGADDSFRPDAQNVVRLSTLTTYTGPGLTTGRFFEAKAVQLIATTPIEDGSARLWQCVMLKREPGMSDAQAQERLATFNKYMVKGLGVEDGQIWANKRAAIKIMQLPSDGPFRQARIWYSQFFNPRHRANEILSPVNGLHTVRGVPVFAARAAE